MPATYSGMIALNTSSLLGLYRIWLRRASAFCCSVGSMDSGSTSMVAAVWVIMESNRV
ncbi:Uncharacterised protein [Alistipes sp. cv1]|nr:Uncharacterised protein [Faecalibacterium prausnitzii]